ncbi:MAG: hypothetical protein ACQEXJ_18865 [Myxococcota bacterium]
MAIEFDREELQELKEMVHTRLGDLASESRHAMVHDYRKVLKAKRQRLSSIEEKLDVELAEED